jgi:hypothetical protein
VCGRDRASPQQTGIAALDPAGTRSTESEANTTILVQLVSFIKQLRGLLYLVDDYLTYGFSGCELSSKQLAQTTAQRNNAGKPEGIHLMIGRRREPMVQVNTSQQPNILILWGDDSGWRNISYNCRGH